MEFAYYKQEFIKAAISAGYSELNIQRCLDYAEPLINKNLPVIYNTSHLSGLVGYKTKYLKRAVTYTSFYYNDYKILKKNKTYRIISEPLPSLKEIQVWILENILNEVKVSPYAKAYKQNVKLMENLKFHKKQAKVFTIDLKNFFPSITLDCVNEIFLNLGYSRLIANLLAKLCCKENCLPQGSPTSPYLSNIYMIKADEIIANYCLEKKIRYTRYADDLSFSGNFDENELMNVVSSIIAEMNLEINYKKVKLMKQGSRQTVTGIVVNEKPQVVFHKRNELRQTMYYIQKFGLEDHMKHQKILQSNYLEHLLGKINFILQLNSSDKEFKGYKQYLNKLKQQRELL
ncbi:reverse transcriptase domain-containing protein [Flavobacterium bizetiae]|uniref:reverse transcriptase domain-containing protein n=1 Tax=Flavobacterium bizetiae TaxID=2704140 RepID=UPI003757AC8D